MPRQSDSLYCSPGLSLVSAFACGSMVLFFLGSSVCQLCWQTLLPKKICNRSRGWFGGATPRHMLLFFAGCWQRSGQHPAKKKDSREPDGPHSPRRGIPLNAYENILLGSESPSSLLFCPLRWQKTPTKEESSALPKAKKRFLHKTWFHNGRFRFTVYRSCEPCLTQHVHWVV